MKYSLLGSLLLLCSTFLFPHHTVFGEVFPTPLRFTNENWLLLPHPKVATFSQSIDGRWNGVTEDGRLFYQYVVPNPYGIRVERFEMEDHYHYIVNGEIADSLTEVSALLAQAYNETFAG